MTQTSDLLSQGEVTAELMGLWNVSGTHSFLRMQECDPWHEYLLAQALGSSTPDPWDIFWKDPEASAITLASYIPVTDGKTGFLFNGETLNDIAFVVKICNEFQQLKADVSQHVRREHDAWRSSLDTDNDPRSVPWLRADNDAAIAVIVALHHMRILSAKGDPILEELMDSLDEWEFMTSSLESELGHRDITIAFVQCSPDFEPKTPALNPLNLLALREVMNAQPEATEAISDFDRNPGEYHRLLAYLTNQTMVEAPGYGRVPVEVLAVVENSELDVSLLRPELNMLRYQVFGSRFAVAQKRVLIADAPGLGKTIQAIAVAAHHVANGAQRTLIVVPMAVLKNWEEEVRNWSFIELKTAHGKHRKETWDTWQREGGVLLTTYEGLEGVGVHQSAVEVLIVDEAQCVKNPYSRRSERVQSLAKRSEVVTLLSGTPLENHFDDLRFLIQILDPDLAQQAHTAESQPAEFRAIISERYLRRRVAEVVDQLPRITFIDEIIPMNTAQRTAYSDATRAGNFMAMRRAAFAEGETASTKIQRLNEIIDYALKSGESVLVFSYFRSVLSSLARELGDNVTGVLTGETPAAKRQELSERIGKETKGVLLCQIEAGGTGLNMTGANVVILCEPQVKPSIEIQASARAHRIGQESEVRVHRLIAHDSVEERLIRLTQKKTDAFDTFADSSLLAELSEEATSPEVSTSLLVQEEQIRLGLPAFAQSWDEVPTSVDNRRIPAEGDR